MRTFAGFTSRRSSLEWTCLVALLIVCAGVIGVLRWREFEDSGAEERARLQAQVRAVGDQLALMLTAIDKGLRNVEVEANALPPTLDAAAAARSISDHLTGLDTVAAATDSLDLVDAKGTVTASSQASRIGRSMAHRTCFTEALARPDSLLHFCAPFQSPEKVWSFELLRIRHDTAGRPAGALVATLAPAYLFAVLPSALYAADMRAALIREGIVMVTAPRGVPPIGADLAARPNSLYSQFRAMKVSDAVFSGKRSNSDERRLVAYQTVNPLDPRLDVPLLVIVSRYEPAVYRPWLLTTQLLASLWLLAAGAGSVALYVAQRRRRVLANVASALRKQRMAELERLELVVTGAQLSMWVWHAASNVLELDERCLSMIGSSGASVAWPMRDWRARMHPDDTALVARTVRRQLAGELDMAQYDYRVRHADGHWVWLLARGKLVERDANGAALRLAGTHQDITERKLAEQALRASESQLRLITDALPSTVGRFDSERRFLFANPAHERLLGLRPDQLIGRRLDEAFGPHAVAGWEPVIRRAEGGEQVTFETSFELPAVGTRHVLVTLAPDFDATGAVCGYFSIATDITERRAAEIERRLFEERLRETQKMDSIGTLAGGIAHDFNNVLAAIIGNAELALQELGEGHPAASSLEQISRASQRARGLVQQILTFSRKEPQKLVNQPLRPLIEDTLALLGATLPARVELVTKLSDVPLHVNADATQMQQVLMNLGTNAWHAFHGSTGRIEVGLEALSVDAAAADSIGGLPAGQYAHLWVRDDGTGMDEATRQRIFEPFFTTKPVGRGTGLGLSVVHGIVKTHLGAIQVETEPGKGTTFHLYLPATQRPSQVGALDEAEARATRGRGQHVMYVDDDDVMVLMVERLLDRAGYRVTSCRGAKEALAAFIDQPRAFDLVVTDYNMPGFSGLDLAAELAHIRPELPVIISSGYLSEDVRDDAARAGVQYLMQKQNTFEELPPLVHRALAAAKATSESVY